MYFPLSRLWKKKAGTEERRLALCWNACEREQMLLSPPANSRTLYGRTSYNRESRLSSGKFQEDLLVHQGWHVQPVSPLKVSYQDKAMKLNSGKE